MFWFCRISNNWGSSLIEKIFNVEKISSRNCKIKKKWILIKNEKKGKIPNWWLILS